MATEVVWAKNRELYTGSYHCPQCGLGSNDLKPEALAVIAGRFGRSLKLHCQICFHNWLTTPEKSAAENLTEVHG